MNVRIEAQRGVDGTVRCELILVGAHGAEVHLPATLAGPEADGIRDVLDSGALYAVEVDAPTLEKATIDAGRLVDVRGVEG